MEYFRLSLLQGPSSRLIERLLHKKFYSLTDGHVSCAEVAASEDRFDHQRSGHTAKSDLKAECAPSGQGRARKSYLSELGEHRDGTEPGQRKLASKLGLR